MTRSRIGLLVVALLVAAALHYVDWTTPLEQRFNDRLRQLRNEDEVVLMADLNRPPVQPADNGAPLLLDALAWFNRFQEEAGKPPGGGTFLRTADDRARATEYVERCGPFIALLEEGVGKPQCRLQVNWEDGPVAEIPTMPLAQAASEVLELRARLDARKPSGSGSAAAAIALMLGVARCQERYNTLPFRVRVNVYRIAARTLEHVVSEPAYDAQGIRSLLEPQLATIEDRLTLRDALVGERAMGLWMIDRLLSGKPLPGNARRSVGSAQEFYEDGLRLLDAMEIAVDVIAEPYPVARKRLAVARRLCDHHPVSQRVIAVVETTFEEYVRALAEIRIARIALAVLDHKASTGAWPRSLRRLSTRFPGGVPLNPLTEQPFLFIRTGDGVHLSAHDSGGRGDDGAFDLVWEMRE